MAFALLVALVAAGLLARRYDPPAAGPLPSLATIAVGRQPTRLAAGDGALWVVSQRGGTVSRVDPASNRVVATIRVGDTAADVAVGWGAVWVGGWSRQQGDTVVRIDPRNNRVVATIKTGGRPVHIAADDRSVWVAYPLDTLVKRIDPRTNTVVGSLRVAQPQGVAMGFGSVWVPSQRGREVLRLDPRTGPRTVQDAGRVPVAGEPALLAVGPDAIWVGTTDHTLHRIDPQSGAVTATSPAGRPLHGMTVDGGSLWSVNSVADTVSRARLPG